MNNEIRIPASASLNITLRLLAKKPVRPETQVLQEPKIQAALADVVGLENIPKCSRCQNGGSFSRLALPQMTYLAALVLAVNGMDWQASVLFTVSSLCVYNCTELSNQTRYSKFRFVPPLRSSSRQRRIHYRRCNYSV